MGFRRCVRSDTAVQHRFINPQRNVERTLRVYGAAWNADNFNNIKNMEQYETLDLVVGHEIEPFSWGAQLVDGTRKGQFVQTKRLFLRTCHPHFLACWVNRFIFPALQELYLLECRLHHTTFSPKQVKVFSDFDEGKPVIFLPSRNIRVLAWNLTNVTIMGQPPPEEDFA